MDKAVLISIHPMWCELIMSGQKTVEIRKTKPKLKPPFRCFVYQTQPKQGGRGGHSGKVIGEFLCYDIIPVTEENKDYFARRGCVSAKEMLKYSDGKPLYAWIIDDPVRYSEALPVNVFFNECTKQDCEKCGELQYDDPRNAWWCVDKKHLKHPPVSWCYVEGEIDA